jgi:sensor domain CHASE-containing protein
MKAISIMTASLNRLSFQIVRSLFIVVCVGLLSLVFVGHNAINIADQNARAQQERFAAKRLTAAIEVLPEQQRSATVWDDAVEQTAARDTKWMDDNLGSWWNAPTGVVHLLG